ncbi:hypothetical protein [Kribbella sp. NPDC050459]|uniref:hypothetical protein n=1 Tax=Kribbella sp. NPDC050459 TaxID=3155785 RepID=UPI0033DDA4EF
MREAESFVSLAEAVAEGRLSAREFKVLCRPLFQFSHCHFLSREEFVAARDLFFVSDEYWDGAGDPPPDHLTAAEVRAKVAEIAVRLRTLMTEDEQRIRLRESRAEDPGESLA